MKSEFLQSAEWLRLQEATGKEIIPYEADGFVANGIIHRLPLVGTYLYVPRGPICDNFQFSIFNFQQNIQKLIERGKEKNVKWIRIEPETEDILEEMKKTASCKVVRAPHDMQPREIFRVNITPSEEELLAQMKSKTRYNIRLAEKREVRVFETREEKHVATFLDLITATSGRKGITAHPRRYYEQFFQTLPATMCRLFVAEYQGAVIAANLVLFYGETVTYLHGGTADVHRDVMAPYLLQWEQMKTAKKEGFRFYDFGGVKTISSQQPTVNKKQQSENRSDWSGISKFKTGFSPDTPPSVFPGSYDIVLERRSYFLYALLSTLMRFVVSLRKMSR